jgi:hypothetical protein
MDLPPNIGEIRARDPQYAEEIEAFAAEVVRQFGPRMTALQEEEEAIRQAAIALDQRRVTLRQRYQVLKVDRAAAGLHKFPPPPEKRS